MVEGLVKDVMGLCYLTFSFFFSFLLPSISALLHALLTSVPL